jgi:hypothetical protein
MSRRVDAGSAESYCWAMSTRNRALGFGGSAVTVVAAAVAGALIGGIAGEVVELSLGSLGAITFVALIFLEVGLSEDRERAREQRARRSESFRRLPRRRRRTQ